MSIGFIGLGAMGRGMAANLLKAGEPLVVWNRNPGPVQELVDKGAQRAANASDAGRVDVLFTMLSDDAAVRAVLYDDGVFDALAPGSVHVNMATVSVEFAREMARVHAEKGIGYLAAPVLGRSDVAAAGKLNILAGGPIDLIKRVQPYFDLMGQKTWPFGDLPEQANAVKLGANLTLALAVEAMGESSALARAYGIAPADFLDLLASTLFAGSPVYKGYGGMIAQERYSPAGFKLALGLKDVNLALDAGRDKGVRMAAGQAVRDNLQRAVQQGDGELDLAALARRSAPISAA
ncbi:NAD(P)-dependent oxidoreductase [Massilia solisilvae]|uniref:NAD(P)-dependent oxidoreductase n=1 Tax=Massilia solisilvae TaxID=1811225 RepID=A0ABT2BFN4_9BURK|nr:NAD(P)-dependent oxidoreductase [Massilia solisilvae]MCS0606885.1 NAD(P)-dependent oxidoreductase [Massilia solisilvae]